MDRCQSLTSQIPRIGLLVWMKTKYISNFMISFKRLLKKWRLLNQLDIFIFVTRCSVSISMIDYFFVWWEWISFRLLYTKYCLIFLVGLHTIKTHSTKRDKRSDLEHSPEQLTEYQDRNIKKITNISRLRSYTNYWCWITTLLYFI